MTSTIETNRKTNTAILTGLYETLKDTHYKYISWVIGHSDYMDWHEIEVDEKHLTIKKYSIPVFRIYWSWNEPKVYLESGLVNVRLIGTKEALQAGIQAVEKAAKAAEKELELFEL